MKKKRPCRMITGDCAEEMSDMRANSVDSIVCDPPYGLEFMGKEWDKLSGQPGYNERGRITNRANESHNPSRGAGGRPVNSFQAGLPMQEWHEAWAREALRVLKPGGYLLAFGGTRTYHRLACAIEDAGFEIRDSIIWLYGTGFPKSLNLKDEWQGWGTALKPAHEPIVVARKPLTGTVAANVLLHGTGALNIDASRIATGDGLSGGAYAKRGSLRHDGTENWRYKRDGGAGEYTQPTGRWPANVILDESRAAELDAQSGNARSSGMYKKGSRPQGDKAGPASIPIDGITSTAYNDKGGASRFFYVAKASRAERNAGLEGFTEEVSSKMGAGLKSSVGASAEAHGLSAGTTSSEDRRAANNHPTVKPLTLMRYLVRIVTPPGGIVLDPFTGSGTTGCAAVLEEFRFIGIDNNPKYVEIAMARIRHWYKLR